MTESIRARLGEPKSTQFRSNRFFLQNNGWFFYTREGTTKGPYATREQAGNMVSQYVERQITRDRSRAYS